MEYRRVTGEDRIRIKDSLDAGLSKSAIADKLGFHKRTIGREISRNKGGRGYRPKQAHAKATAREESKHGPYKMNPVIMAQIIECLKLKWSPEQISNPLLAVTPFEVKFDLRVRNPSVSAFCLIALNRSAFDFSSHGILRDRNILR